MIYKTRPTFAKSSSVDLSPAYQSLITEALRRADGNQSCATQMLGISPQALHKRLKQQDNE